jgi:hypothetical protein
VLSGSRLRDYATFSHAQGEEGLPEGIVDFMGSGVEEVFAL